MIYGSVLYKISRKEKVFLLGANVVNIGIVYEFAVLLLNNIFLNKNHIGTINRSSRKTGCSNIIFYCGGSNLANSSSITLSN
jgi:hypothetical protein